MLIIIQMRQCNQYIVHEHHVFQVVNELNISGASAISRLMDRDCHMIHIYYVMDL